VSGKVSDQDVLDAIVDLSRKGAVPTYRELADELGFASWSTARYRVLQLELGGKVERKEHSARSLKVKGGNRGQA